MDPNGAIEIVYPNDNNNNNNIIITIKRKKKINPREGGVRVERDLFFSLCFFFSSTKIGPQVFVGAEGKVDLRDESYA